MSLLRFLPGLVLMALIVAIANFAAHQPSLSAIGASPLILAIILGALIGNIKPKLAHGTVQPGLRFSQKILLRTGVALYGFNLSAQQIAEAGRSGLFIDLFMLCSTLAIGYLIGTRWLRMDRQLSLLIAAGSAICGAAAVVATVSVLRMTENEQIRKTATAIATLVLFGTLAMLLYPAIFTWIGGNRSNFGTYIGSTVHEVAQVVAIGNIIGGEAAHNAVIVKMIRVLMLVPFLIALSFWTAKKSGDAENKKIIIPWFALIFVLFACLNSIVTLPQNLLLALRQTGMLCLSFAMAAFGMETSISLMRQAGVKPLVLGAALFAYLVIIGGWVNLYLSL